MQEVNHFIYILPDNAFFSISVCRDKFFDSFATYWRIRSALKE